MATITITSFEGYAIVDIDGKQSTYQRNGQIKVLTDDSSGNIAYFYDDERLLAKYRDRINLDISADTIDIDGVTVFADAGALVAALTPVFFSPNQIAFQSPFVDAANRLRVSQMNTL